MPPPFLNGLSNSLRQRPLATVLIAAVFVALGIWGLVITRATSVISIDSQPEDGSVLLPAKTVTGQGAAGQYVLFGSAGSPTAVTALTVVATDGVVNNAMCFDSSMSNQAGCIQAKPGDPSKARFGLYDIVNKSFLAKTGWLGFVDATKPTAVATLNCSGGNQFYGFGPFTNGAKKTYYGISLHGASGAYGSIDSSSHKCANDISGTPSFSQWAAVAIKCSGAAGSVTVDTKKKLEDAIANNPGGTEICLAAGGHYMLSVPLKPKTGMKIIGNPFNRTIIDASSITQTDGSTSSFNGGSGGALDNTDVTIANLIVENSPTPGETKCGGCGFGINGGDGWHIYNVHMTHNQLNGFHYHGRGNPKGYVVENSEMTYNGNDDDNGVKSWTTAGLKTTHAGLIKNNVVMYNIGAGVWCDVNCSDGQWTVDNNYLAFNQRSGIAYEISGTGTNGAKIQYNVVVANNQKAANHFSGIIIQNSRNATVNNNIVKDNKWAGIEAYQDNRTDVPIIDNVLIKDNVLNGQNLLGCTVAGVTCTNNN